MFTLERHNGRYNNDHLHEMIGRLFGIGMFRYTERIFKSLESDLARENDVENESSILLHLSSQLGLLFNFLS